MQWNDLATFLAVYDADSYASAGRALGISATTVMRRLQRLSSSLGAVLFQQSTEGLAPTAAAEAIYPSIAIMARQAGLVQRRIGGDEARLSGPVRLTANQFVLDHFLLAHIPAFSQRYPHVELQFLGGNRFFDLAAGDADVALRLRREGGPLAPGENPESLVARFIGEVAIVLIASLAYLERHGPPTPGLSGHRVIAPASDVWLPGLEHLERIGSEARVALRCDAVSGLVNAAAQGMGITAAPAFALLTHPELRALGPAIERSTAWVLSPRDLRRTVRVRVVREFLIDVFLRHAEQLSGEDPLLRYDANLLE